MLLTQLSGHAQNFLSLVLWHLPAEKKKGFDKAFAELSSPERTTALFTNLDFAKLFRLTVPAYVAVPMAIRRLLRNTYYTLLRIVRNESS